MRPRSLLHPVDPARDHVLGPADAEFTLVEYGSYACDHCHAAHTVVRNLRAQFGDRLRYVYRHLPLTDRQLATKAAELAEYASVTDNRFWDVHETLMAGSPRFDEAQLAVVAEQLNVASAADREAAAAATARARVRDDASGGIESGARVTPTFFINGRRYEGAWDEGALAEAIEGAAGFRLRSASLDFVRWGPSSGLLLLAATLVALLLSNSLFGPAVEAFWQSAFGVRFGGAEFALSARDWVNHGLLSVFFLVVGLEIKHEFTVGRLATRRAAVLPIAAAFGGMTLPVLVYLALVPPGDLQMGWGLVIATDTAFAVALIVLLGDRVPVDLRVFLTAAVIVDDLVAILIIALFYTETIAIAYLGAAVALTGLLVLLNRGRIYSPLAYAAVAVLLWFCLHEAGVHATLAGVVLALVIPARPPANLRALMSQAQLVLNAVERDQGHTQRTAISGAALRALNGIYRRLDSPNNKLLHAAEPWSSYVVLPFFALANADLAWTSGLMDGQTRLALGIILGLCVGKPVGITAASWLAVRLRLAQKPESYSWRQLFGAGALAGIGFTMSLFIAAQAFTEDANFRAAKVAIFAASVIAAIIGVAILWRKPRDSE